TRLGRVEEGNTVSDFDPDEIKRHISVSTAVLPLEWRDHKINLLDAPGFGDFLCEIRGAIRVVDAAIIVIDAASGVQVGTEQVWRGAQRRKLSCLVYVNKLDRENADFARVVEEALARLGSSVVPLTVPIGAESGFRGVVEVLHRRACFFGGADGKMEEGPIPDDLVDTVEEYRSQLVERIAENDDALIEKFLADEPIEDAELEAALKGAVCSGALTPLLCGAAGANKGMQLLLDAIVDYLPAPTDKDPVVATNPKTGATVPLSPDPQAPAVALIFKTIVDRFGTLSFFRVYSGTIQSDSHLQNAARGVDGRIGQLQFVRGKEQAPTQTVVAGDIGAVVKLAATRTGDTLSDPAHPLVLDGIDFPAPLFSAAVMPRSNADIDKMASGLAQLTQEDPSLQISKDPVTGETIISGLGESHVQVATERLQRKSGVNVEVKLPRVPYRETVAAAAKQVKYRHKKQTGGSGQFGEVVIDLEPLPDKEFEFAEKIFGGSVPRQYIPGVEKGVRESLERGLLAGYPMVNVKVTLTDGSYHPVDSSEMAFKIAASQAFKQAAQAAQPVILEPVMALKITVPGDHTGDIISDLNGKRAQVQGATPGDDGLSTIEALAPLAEVQRYATDLRQLTQGQGSFTMEFDHYQRVPQHLMDGIVAAAKAGTKD
ncbi:MAG: Elongation factor G-like protein TM_1651, partial [uncultured Thermomicrobiales bacterium]